MTFAHTIGMEPVVVERSEKRAFRAPLAEFERALIDTFVHGRGFDTLRLAQLSSPERDALLSEASVYASGKLAEVESRSHFLDELHE